MDITEIVLAILTIISALVASVIIPWLKLKIEEAKQKMTDQQQDDLLKWSKIAVMAAEMIYKESGMGAIKKKYVRDYLAEHGFVLDEQQVDIAIEAAVLELKNALA